MSDNRLLEIKDGISQSERLFDTLVPKNFEIDAREIPDFLNFIAGLAEHINYYNFSNELDGDWQEFFRSEENVLIVIISQLDLSKQFDRFHNYISALSTCDHDEEFIKLLKDIFDCIFEILGTIHNLKTHFNKYTRSEEINTLSLLVKDLDFDIARAKHYYNDAVFHFHINVHADLYLYVDYKDDDLTDIYTGTTVKEKITAAMPQITALFNYIGAKYNYLVKAAGNYLKRNNLLEKTYPAHVSLLITFLNLYQKHLRPAINGITKRHLDFYYKDLLGIASSKAKPDKVHLLFEPDQGIITVNLGNDEKLIALKPGKQEPITYRLEHPVQISKAKLEEIKTVFISDYPQIISDDREKQDINEAQVYKAGNPLFNAAAYQKKTQEIQSWPMLGEDQHNLSGTLRTMEDTEIGILIASPLFYQKEGDRFIKIKIHFKAESFKEFKDYIQNFKEVANKPEESILHHLLSSAFTLNYSGTEGWEDIENYSVTCNTQSTDNAIEIEFRLLHSDKAMDLYQPLIHSGNYESPFPIIKILVNNYSPHNPYSFLKNTFIERISINVHVKNFTNLKLHNNISTLSPANPFQPFGPQPSIGSFLDIKNTNAFNRYTKDFCINMEWLDLPREDGGFEKYYEAYKGEIKNSSFKVGMSTLSGNQFKPKSGNQQRYNLFESETKNRLSNKTTFANIDFKKIEFLNAPTLAAEDEFTDTQFKEGAIRIELLSPPEAFGHRQFPQLFPETVMNNAKFFKKKLPLPNQPYIPVIKTISIDFTLQHSENFKDAGNESQNNLFLIHQYPFGYHTIYPNNSKKSYYFMPQFNDDSNLYVGISEVEPNQELSVLFQLEEKNFHHTVHEPDIIKWSYLVNNAWQDLDTLSVLNDATNNFVNSGIIRLKMPAEITSGNTLLNPGLFWLRAAVNKSSGTQSKVIAICLNAGTAVRMADSFIESEIDFNLPPGCITGFTRNVKGIQTLRQLFPSFNGRPHETQEKYYIRVSERLRHKHRLVQTRDVMQVILEEFPQILMVKCFGSGLQDALILPGVNVQVVLIPKEMEDGRFISQQPKVNLATLYRVKTFLSKLISPFVQIEVGNPVYEKIKVVCSVIFNDSKMTDHGFYIKRLNEDINRYISPWLYESNSEIKIGAKIFKSDLFMLIKNLPYVSYVTGFSAVHFYNTKSGDTADFDAEILDTAVDIIDYVSGSSPAAVLIPSASHLITVLTQPGYHPPAQTGIGGFTVGEELLVTGKYDIENKPLPPALLKTEDMETFNLIISHDIE